MIALSGLFLFAGSVVQTDAPGVRLRAAIEKEEVEGDLQAAIEQYKNIIADSGDNRTVAASALLRLGGCYEKLGRDEARKTYERLVQDYADQSEQARAAQARLAALSQTVDDGKKPAFTIRQILTDVADSFASSPDGKYLLFQDANSGNLAIHNLETGRNRPLTEEGSWGAVTQFVESASWSPDNKQVAYTWYNGASGCLELRIVSKEGGKPRILVQCEDDSSVRRWIKTYDWSPDGKQILIFLSKELLGKEDVTFQIVLVSSADGAAKPIKTFEGLRGSLQGPTTSGKDWPEFMCFSQDGRYIAYDRPPEGETAEHDIFLISIDGNHEASLVKHPAHDRLVGWPPGGKGILFVSNRTDSRDLLFLPVLSGQAQDKPELVKKSVGQITPLGFTRSGDFYYKQSMQSADIYVATMDRESGRILSPPEKGIKRFEGSNRWPAYSPDGKYLAYVRMKTKNSSVLCLYSLETGNVREFHSKWNRIEGPNWSPDSRFIYFEVAADEGKAIYRADIQNGEFSHVLTKPLDRRMHCSASSDGMGLIISRQTSKDGYVWEIVYRHLASGDEKHIFTNPSTRRIGVNISPDGRRLAIMSQEGILKVMPIGGGESRELLRVKQFSASAFPFIEWTADGKYILFQQATITDDNVLQTSLWRISVDGGNPEDLNLKMRYFGEMSAHPDGQHLAFFSPGIRDASPAVWIMENFLPQSKQEEGGIQ